MIRLQKKPAKHLISAYNLMMAEMRKVFEHAPPSDKTLQHTLESAKHQAIDLGEVTAEEAHEIGEYIKRDVNDAAETMMESSDEFYDWLLLDIDMIECKVMELYLTVANRTRIELEQFTRPLADSEHHRIETVQVFRSGEINGPGSLVCEGCGDVTHFLSSGGISDCLQCGCRTFIRKDGES